MLCHLLYRWVQRQKSLRQNYSPQILPKSIWELASNSIVVVWNIPVGIDSWWLQDVLHWFRHHSLLKRICWVVACSFVPTRELVQSQTQIVLRDQIIHHYLLLVIRLPYHCSAVLYVFRRRSDWVVWRIRHPEQWLGRTESSEY